MSSRWPAIPAPEQSLASLQATVGALKEAVELLTGQRGPVAEYSVDQMVLDLTSRNENAFGRVFEVNEANTTSTTALPQRTTIIEAALNTPTTGLQARFTGLTVATVDITNSTSLIRRMDTVESRAGEATASGHVRLQAVTAPTGSSAAYEWQITAGAHSVGMTALVDSFGNGSMAFSASQFLFTDPSYNGGIPGNVWSYSSGVIHFNVPVEIRTTDLADKAATNSNGSSNSSLASSGTISTNLTVQAGTRVEVTVSFWNAGTLTPPANRAAGTGTLPVSRIYNIQVDGSTTDSVTVYDTMVGAPLSGAVVLYDFAPGNFSATFFYTSLTAGLHTFSCVNAAASTMGASIMVTELRR